MPLRCDLLARVCLRRQEKGRVTGREAPAAQSELFAGCVTCALGAEVARRCGESPPAPGTVKRDAPKPRKPAAPRDARPSCDAARCGNPVRPHRLVAEDLRGFCVRCRETVRRRVERGEDRGAVIRDLRAAGANVEPCALGCGAARAYAFRRTHPRLAELCRYHRDRAHSIAQRSGCSPEAAVDRLAALVARGAGGAKPGGAE